MRRERGQVEQPDGGGSQPPAPGVGDPPPDGLDVETGSDAEHVASLRALERWRALLESPTVGVALMEGASRFKEVNVRFCELLGYSREELIGKTWMEFTHPEDVDRDAAAAADVAAGRAPTFATEKRYVRKDGSIFWALLSASPIRERDGSVKDVLVVVQDVSARRKAEDALRTAHRDLNAHLTLGPLAIVQWSPEYRVTRYDARAEEMFGWTADEVLGRRIDEVPWIPAEDWPSVKALTLDMLSGARPANVNANRNRRKDGSIIHCEWYNSCLYDPDGKLASVFSLVLDVTDRERAREAVAASETRLRTVIENSSDAIYHLDLATGRFLFVSPTQERVTGFTSSELEAMTRAEALERVHPDDRHLLVEIQARLDARPGTSQQVEYRWRTKSGGYRWLGDSRSYVRGEDGRPVAIVGATRDVTEQRTMQARLASASKLAGLGTLAGGMAHELNGPLAVVLSSQALVVEELRALDARRAEGLEPRDVEKVHEACLESLADAMEATRRIARVVRTMSALGRSDRPRGRSRISAVVEDAISWLPHPYPERATVDVRVDEDLEVEGATTQLGQALAHLVTNAIQATAPSGEGRVAVRAGPGSPGMVRVEVSDDGAGIPPKDLERIFDPFFTTRPVGQGVGLGLPVCHAIVTAHGGTISVTSEVGNGSTFTVELPVAAGPA